MSAKRLFLSRGDLRISRLRPNLCFGILAAIVTSIPLSGGAIVNALTQTNLAIPPASDQASTNANPAKGSLPMSNMNMSNMAGGTTNKTTVTRDSVTVLLEGKTIPAKGFLHLYDSTPYMVLNGHVALHIPCDSNSKPNVDVLIGPAPNFTKVQPDIIQGGLSHPGQMCLYHADVNSDPSKKIYQTDIAIANPMNQTIVFPPTSTVVIGVNGIMPEVPGG